MLYSVKNVVEEDNKIEYNDGIRKIFLYTGGRNGGTKSLKDLLLYMEKSVEENAVDDDLKRLHSNVQRLKGRREIGVKYMNMQEIIKYREKEAAKEAAEETANEMSQLIKVLIEAGRIEDLKRSAEDSEFREKLLKELEKNI